MFLIFKFFGFSGFSGHFLEKPFVDAFKLLSLALQIWLAKPHFPEYNGRETTLSKCLLAAAFSGSRYFLLPFLLLGGDTYD